MVAGEVHVKRECYTLCGLKGQTEKAPRVPRGGSSELIRIIVSCRRDPGQSVRDPRRLVPLSPERHGREIRRIGFHQQPVSWDHSDEIVVCPLVEGDDPAERHIPPRGERELRQRM
jgi:hypothetical protein